MHTYNSGWTVETQERCPRCGSKHLWDLGGGVTGCLSCRNLNAPAEMSFEELAEYHEKMRSAKTVTDAVAKRLGV